MGLAKRQLEEQMNRTSHLDCCSKCGKVLRTREEREIFVCESCLEYQLSKD